VGSAWGCAHDGATEPIDIGVDQETRLRRSMRPDVLDHDARKADDRAPRRRRLGSAFGHEGTTETHRATRVDIEVDVDVVDLDLADLDFQIALTEKERLDGRIGRELHAHA